MCTLGPSVPTIETSPFRSNEFSLVIDPDTELPMCGDHASPWHAFGTSTNDRHLDRFLSTVGVIRIPRFGLLVCAGDLVWLVTSQ